MSGVRRQFETAVGFARDVRDTLAGHLAPANVSFRGSFANGSHDGYSDVDLLAEVHARLDGWFFSALERRMMKLYGPALVRYDPDHRNSHDSQHVRFSFYELPVFWRVDLEIVSDRETVKKWPSPFPTWPVGTSALMNIVWAVKYHWRKDDESADLYLGSACEKLRTKRLPYAARNALEVLDLLEDRDDTDKILLSKIRDAIGVQERQSGHLHRD